MNGCLSGCVRDLTADELLSAARRYIGDLDRPGLRIRVHDQHLGIVLVSWRQQGCLYGPLGGSTYSAWRFDVPMIGDPWLMGFGLALATRAEAEAAALSDRHPDTQ